MPMPPISPSRFEVVHDALPAIVARPRVFPDVELEQVDRVEAEVLEARLGVFADVVGRKHSSSGKSARDGHVRFFGGTLVAV